MSAVTRQVMREICLLFAARLPDSRYRFREHVGSGTLVVSCKMSLAGVSGVLVAHWFITPRAVYLNTSYNVTVFYTAPGKSKTMRVFSDRCMVEDYAKSRIAEQVNEIASGQIPKSFNAWGWIG